LRRLQHAVTRVDGPAQINHPGARARGRIFQSASH
jgi:hypothetical protein